jgi:hypothetical protein
MTSAIIEYDSKSRSKYVKGFAMAMALGVVGLWWVRYRWGDHLLWPVLLTCLVVLFLVVTSCLVIVDRLKTKFVESIKLSESQSSRVVRAGCRRLGLELKTPALMHFLSWSLNEADGANCLIREWVYQEDLLKENLTFLRRGHWHEPVRILHVGDALGLWKMKLEIRVAGEEYYVMPSRCCTPRVNWPRNFVSGEDSSNQGKAEGDRIDYRLFQPGDSARYLAWKLIARRDPKAPLLVRKPETVKSPSVGFFFLPGDNDEAAAQLMVYLLEKGPFGSSWLFSLPSEKLKIFEGLKHHADAAMRAIAKSGFRFLKKDQVAQSANMPDDISRSSATIEWFTESLKKRGVGSVIIVTGTHPKEPNLDYFKKPSVYGRHTLIAYDEQGKKPDEDEFKGTDRTLIGITVE